MDYNIEKLKEIKGDSNFILGNAKDIALNLLSELAPYGKVLFLSTFDAFKKYGVSLIEDIKQKGGQTINVILDEKTPLSIQTVGGLFCAPENVRAVVAMDGRLFPLASYYGGLRNIPSILIDSAFLTSGALLKKIPVINGNTIDLWEADVKRFWVIDMCDDDFYQKASIYLISTIVRVVDNIILGRLGLIDFNSNDYLALNQIVYQIIFKTVWDEKEKRQVLDNCAKIERTLSCLQTHVSAINVSSYIYSGSFTLNDRNSAHIGYNIICQYYNAISNGNCLNVNDYRERAELLNLLIGYDEKQLLSNFYLETKQFEKFSPAHLNDLRLCLYKCKFVVKKLLENVDKPSLKRKKLNVAIKCAGDLPNFMNGMTAIRELGLQSIK